MKMIFRNITLSIALMSIAFGNESIQIEEPDAMKTAVCVNVMKKTEDTFGAFPPEYKDIKSLCVNYPNYVKHFVDTFVNDDSTVLEQLQLFTTRLPAKQVAVVNDICENDYKGHEQTCYIYMKRILTAKNALYNPAKPSEAVTAMAMDINFRGAKNSINNYGVEAQAYKTFVKAVIASDFKAADSAVQSNFKRYEEDYFNALVLPTPEEMQ